MFLLPPSFKCTELSGWQSWVQTWGLFSTLSHCHLDREKKVVGGGQQAWAKVGRELQPVARLPALSSFPRLGAGHFQNGMHVGHHARRRATPEIPFVDNSNKQEIFSWFLLPPEEPPALSRPFAKIYVSTYLMTYVGKKAMGGCTLGFNAGRSSLSMSPL